MHTGARGSFRMVFGGRPTRCSPGGGACPPEPCSGFCEVPGCPTPTYRGERGLNFMLTFFGPFGGSHPVRQPRAMADVSRRAELPFFWPHSQELGSCGALPSSLWGRVTVVRGPFSLPGGPVRGRGGRTLAAWPPSAGERPRLAAQGPPGV